MPATCRHGCAELPIGVFSLPAGCWCFPADTEQALCAQHALKAVQRFSAELVEDLTLSGNVDKIVKRWAL